MDKYKGTAFVASLNGEQAEAAIKAFHQSRLRERELSVQLQPTDALLCVAKLPPSTDPGSVRSWCGPLAA